jgi:hypothetical protein
MAIPRLFVNHLGIMDITGIKQKALPIPIRTPQVKYMCHNALICDVNKNDIPFNSPPIATMGRGPYLSLNLPQTTPAPPLIRIVTERAPEMAPLSQLNSIVIGFKNTPKLYIVSPYVIRTPMEMATITHP